MILHQTAPRRKGEPVCVELPSGQVKTLGWRLRLPDGRWLLNCRRSYSKHIYRIDQSWGISSDALKLCDVVCIFETESQRRFYATAEAIRKGVFRHFKSQGFERQRFLPLQFWSDSMPESPLLLRAAKQKLLW